MQMNKNQKYCTFLSPLLCAPHNITWFAFFAFGSASCPFHHSVLVISMNFNNIIAVCHPRSGIQRHIVICMNFKTLEQSHQTFNMISFKPIIVVINRWMGSTIRIDQPPQKGLHYAPSWRFFVCFPIKKQISRQNMLGCCKSCNGNIWKHFAFDWPK